MSKHRNPDHYYLTHADQKRLREKLTAIRDLADDLAITTTRQDRTQRSDLGKPRRPKRAESSLPFHWGAAKATHDLHNTLATWVRLVCEHRAVDYNGTNTILGLARWLEVNMTALAMTPGAEEAYEDIAGAMKRCQREIDLPPEDHVVIDRARVESANRQVVTGPQVEVIARKLGATGMHLDRKRVSYLRRRGLVKGRQSESGEWFYELGDVLHAHVKATTYKRKGA